MQPTFDLPVVQPTTVRKRDGKTTQPFDVGKIESAVRKAWLEVEGAADAEEVHRVVSFVAATLPADIADVEQIQDMVEVALMRAKKFAVAKAYIIYRKMRAEARGERHHPDPLAVSDYIHAAKYARYLPDQQRREIYEETVARVEAMHLRRFAHLPADRLEEIRRAFGFVYDKRVLPSMRSMQFGGRAVEVNHARQYNCSATLIDRPRAFAEAMFLLLSGCGVGYSVQFEHVEKLPLLLDVDPKKVIHHVIEDTIEGWALALDALVNGYIGGYHVEFAYHQIRAAGSPLKTSGGRAPGHCKLKLALERIREVLEGAQGRQLRPIECHRILCHAADAVLSGGIRRSAMICLFSLEDSELMNIKSDRGWYPREPWLANANNSVVLKRDEVKEKQFKRIFGMTRNYGEPGIFFVEDYNHATNPCQAGWSTVLTPDGIRTFDDIDVGSTIWSGKQWTKVTNKVMTGVKPVFGYHTRAGVFYGTEQHHVISNGERIEARNAETIDRALGGAEGIETLDPQKIMDGLVLGDGMVHHASNDAVWLLIGDDDSDYHQSEVKHLILKHRRAASSRAWEISTTLAAHEVPLTYRREIPDRFRFGGETAVRAFLRGLYSANGSICGDRVTLKASSLDVILQAQEMLSSIGIAAYYTVNKVHDVAFANGTYTCRESYDLNITHDRQRFAQMIGFIQVDKMERLATACAKPASRKPPKVSFEVVDIESLGEEPVYDITVEADEHTYWTGGMLVSNCCEINLQPVLAHADGTTSTGWATCNLTEINAAKLTSFDDFCEAAWAATVIGTLQASYTDMAFLGKTTEAIVRRDALLGVGMTGMQDAPHVACDPSFQQAVAERVVEWNREWAAVLGINSAARTTCVKPSGTTSLELGNVGSGIHPHHARRYIRRVTADEYETVFQAFKQVNPHMCQQMPSGKWVIEFPVEAPEGATLKEDLTAEQFLETVRSTQAHWVKPGTGRGTANHNVSNTITVGPDEWKTVADYLWKHRDSFTGVSLVPAAADTIYAFAPFEAIRTEAQERRWNELISGYRPLDYYSMVETEDGTSVSAEPACAGGACLIA